jgi:hypothetical protein
MAIKRLVRRQLRREIDGQPHAFWIEPGRDKEPHIVDLHHFYEGGRGADLEPRYRRNWGGDFRARSSLADEFCALIETTRPTKDEFDSDVSAWRLLHRFLDEHPAPIDVQTIADLNDIHGALLKSWLQARGIKNSTTYRRIKTIVDRMRDMAGLPDLLWPARDPDRLDPADAVDEHGIVRLFSALKSEARCIKQMFWEGEHLAGLIRSGRAKSLTASVPAASRWTECQASYMRNLAAGPIPHRSAFESDDWMVGPTYLAPTMSDLNRNGLFGALRWYHPSRRDTQVFLWLFMIGTGWNLATVLSIDISDEKQWYETHPHKAGYAVMHAFKGRPGKHVFGISMMKPEFHPYAVMKFMIERTKGLRETLRRDLADAQASYASFPTYDLKKKIIRLRRWIKSPWLYHSYNDPGSVLSFTNDHSSMLNEFIREVVKLNSLEEDHPTLLYFTTSMARDAWIGHAYVKSGYQVLIAQLAAQHANLRTLRHYLNRHRYRRDSEKAVRKVMDHTFREIRAGQRLDPVRVKILVAYGKITPEQADRLLDLRQRTRLGMGCLEPTKPPPDLVPDHVPGTICRPQPCAGCTHSRSFDESLVPLAEWLADLHFVRKHRPLPSWDGTSFSDEAEWIERTLQQFDEAGVWAAYEHRTRRLETGEVQPYDTYPLYSKRKMVRPD